MVNSNKKAGLGNTLQRAQKQAITRRNPKKTDRHTVEANPNQDNAKLNLQSITAQTNLDEFFQEAELAGKQFITERRNIAIIEEDQSQVSLYTKDEQLATKFSQSVDVTDLTSSLSVPRRPKWGQDTTPEVLAEREKLTFLTWRKKLAIIQENENLILTPFEKNLEVWRQLWRVIERSDIVVQILDCRNPLLYLCDDLMKYVDEEFEGKKMNLILLNKADYLSKEQRKIWSEYFKSRHLKTIFFSALLETELSKNLKSEILESENNETSDGNSGQRIPYENDNEGNTEVIKKLETDLALKINSDDDDTRIFDKFELLDTWHVLLEKLRSSTCMKSDALSQVNYVEDHISEQSIHVNLPTVGLVGYPNVGKSSTINALLSAKRVAVSATPGKTKHFQTFLLGKDMMLCDCPGLVFPNFVSCKSEMIINGILPIDQMRDCLGPVRIIVNRIPRGFLEELYGLAFEHDAKQNISADDLLNALGFMRGYMTARGLPDIARAARKVCKDYINGKILYCEPPPNCDRKLFYSCSKLAEIMRRIEEKGNSSNTALRITDRQKRLMAQAKGTDVSSSEFDATYFRARTGGVHIIGLPGIGNMTQPIGSQIGVKLPKRERKHKKKEKLRRVFRDLDI